MPWTPQEFASRHNKNLKGKAATKASHMANAILASGAPEGIAIATANKYANKIAHQQHNPLEHIAHKDCHDPNAFHGLI